MFERLLDLLQRSASIRWQLLIYLYFSGTYSSIVNMCRLAYANAASSPTFGYARGRHIYQSPCKSLKGLNNGPSPAAAARAHSSWCLPPLYPVMELYQYLSMLTLVYVILINSLPLEYYLELLVGPLESPSHCYVPGRLMLYSTLPQQTALGVALIHLTWHLSMYHKFKQFDLNMVACMIQDDELIQREHQTIAKQLELSGSKAGFNHYQLYLSNILYHPERFRGRDIYILRPNRTLKARQAVARFTAKCSLISGSVFLVLVLLAGPVIISSVFRDLTYLDRYPGCSPQLERELKLDHLSWGSVSLWGHWHKTITNLVDLWENWVLWFDSGAAIAITLSFTYLFNYDFLYYWSKIELKLDQLDALLKFKWSNQTSIGATSSSILEGPVGSQTMREPEWYQYAKSFRHRRAHKGNFLRTMRPTAGLNLLGADEDDNNDQKHGINNEKQAMCLEETITLLQAQLIDFFLQLRAVDRLVSDIVTYSVIIWLCIFTFGTVYFLENGATRVAFELRIIQVIAVITLAVENVLLLALRRTLNHSYKTVCSIMAYDQSRFKARFAKILDFWSGRHGASSWTLFHRYAFTSTTSLTLVGWSVSFVMVCENFLSHRQP